MDPLSLAAGVIAVIQLANHVITLCLDLHSSMSARKELDRIVDEVDALRAILQRMARLQGELQANKSDTSEVETLSKGSAPLSVCRSELESLQEELYKIKGSSSKFGVKSITWIGKEKEIEGRLERLSRAKQTLQLSLSLDHTVLLLESRTHSLAIQATLNDAELEQRRRDIIDWLGPPYPTSTFIDAQKLRSVDTGNWFLHGDAFLRWWKVIPKSVMWVSGIPGSGKTILCSSIIEELNDWCRTEDGRIPIYFFFDFMTRDKGVISTFLRCLLSQIVVQRRSVPESVQTLFEQHHGGFQQPSTKILLETFRKALDEVEQIYLIIDAIDECVERTDLLDTLEEMVGWNMDSLHVLATSRPEKDIEESFQRMKPVHVPLEGARVNKDVEQYIQRRIAKEQWLKKWPEDIQTEITSAITNKAGDMFRLAALQLDGLKKCKTLKALRQTLYSLPKTLDETYSRMLSEIEPDQVQDALKILSWLCFALRPPTLDEVAEILAVDLESGGYDANQKLQDTEDVLSICGSLVVRATDSSGTLKLSHSSVKDYLTSDHILVSSNRTFHITQVAVDVYITKTCIAYLRSRPYKSREDAQSAVVLPGEALTRYATNYWSEHFLRCAPNNGVLALVQELFLSDSLRFADWTWVATTMPEGFVPEWPKSHGLDMLLYYAARVRSPALLDILLQNGANINSEGGLYGTALTTSAHVGDYASLELLLSRGADPNIQGGPLGNALQAVAARGWAVGVELLLRHGANVNAHGGKFHTALHAAVRSQGEGEILMEIDSAGSNAIPQNNTADHNAPLNSNVPLGGAANTVKLLLDSGADVNSGGCLQVALYGGHIDLARMLLQRGANLFVEDTQWGNPIEVAAVDGLPTLRFLVEEWIADCRRKDSEGKTALHLAARAGNVETVEYLLSLGMDIDEADSKGWTAIHYASDSFTPDNLKLLLSRWKFNNPISTIWSPLHLACKRNQPEALDLLFGAGFQPTTVATTEPNWKWSLYDIAIVHRNYRLISEDLEPLHPLLKQTPTRALPPSMQIDLERSCNGCFSSVVFKGMLIFGPVFHCDQCPDFDYCFMCKLTAGQTHPHSFTTLPEVREEPLSDLPPSGYWVMPSPLRRD